MDWFKIWREDRESMIDTMARNMAADLQAGYNYFGACIQRQIAEINAAKAKYAADMDRLANMTQAAACRWCHVQLLKSGAIE